MLIVYMQVVVVVALSMMLLSDLVFDLLNSAIS